jgi:hypothetical protein
VETRYEYGENGFRPPKYLIEAALGHERKMGPMAPHTKNQYHELMEPKNVGEQNPA